ncbi:hypothetical protein IAU60_000584 [Kwoniella sp. DSM 27419]
MQAPTMRPAGDQAADRASATGYRSIYLPTDPAVPRPCLTTDTAVAQWHASPGFQAFWGWIRRRCERIKGREIVRGDYQGSSEGIRTLLGMLDRMSEWVEEVPPQPQSNQRFGNLAFRTYIKLVEERLPRLLASTELPLHLLDQLLPLWLQSCAFGHPIRIDYGTGHELAFVLGLWCCVVSGWIGGEGDREDEEDLLVLQVFTRYLDLTTLLQKTYRLEPAGSHGVWGLDDYCFLPYLFGSAQLMDSPLTPSKALDLALSHRSASAVTPSAPITDLYTLSLHHLLLFKHGAAFSEHSPLLFSLSQMKDWNKPHHGLRKMFMGEVVGKRVVVQGLWIGGWCWGEGVPEAKADQGDLRRQAGSALAMETTKAPWAR